MVGLRESSRLRLNASEADASPAGFHTRQGSAVQSTGSVSDHRDLSFIEGQLAAGLRLTISPHALSSAPTNARYRVSKRLFDISLSAVGIALSAPLIALLWILIRLDSRGPVFFRQVRVGEGGRVFTIIKLRTMHVVPPHAHAPASELNSDRVTRVGRHLRRWSLDEIPQFINVLWGDMSLVGPRPELPEIVFSTYQPWQFARFRVPQGMTGWWQVMERGRLRLCEDTADDLFYIERASFWFDLRILLMTIPAVARQARSR